MSAHRHLPLLAMFLSAAGCFAAEDPIYSQFLSLVDTNNPRAQAIKSRSLVDTNNAAMKATGIITNLATLRDQDGLAGVRLGMTMAEVIAAWGKPTWIWSACVDRLPSFTYRDVMLGFEENSLKVIRFSTFYAGPLDRFDGGLSMGSSINDWVRVLGVPTVRQQSATGGSLAYVGAKSTVTLRFHSGELIEIRIEKPKPASKPAQ